MVAQRMGCKICNGDHGYTRCPQPLTAPASPQKLGESLTDYHQRLRYNAYMREWTVRKMADPDYRSKVRAQQNARAKAHPDSPARVRSRKHMRQKAAWLAEQKAKPCMDCGGTFPSECMQFDHRPGEMKSFNISMRARSTHARVLAEIAKCDLVCANCHAIRTAQRKRAQLKPQEAVYVQPARSAGKVCGPSGPPSSAKNLRFFFRARPARQLGTHPTCVCPFGAGPCQWSVVPWVL